MRDFSPFCTYFYKMVCQECEGMGKQGSAAFSMRFSVSLMGKAKRILGSYMQ
jgi:hypothetical protein